MSRRSYLALAVFLALVLAPHFAWGDVHHNGCSRSGYHRGRSRVVYVRIWVPGHYECRVERIHHPGCWEEVVEPPVFERRRVLVIDPCTGERWWEERTVMVRPERRVRRYVPGWWEERTARVWIPGRWVCVRR